MTDQSAGGGDQNGQGFWGQKGITDDTSFFRHITFLFRQLVAEHRTGIPVKILKVHGGGVGPPPTVDVQIMVKQMDGVGNASSHSTIYGIPAARNQGGANVVINDPLVGDTGHLVIADRDISSWKANQGAESNPGSFRRGDLSDGVYHHAVSMPITPKQYVHFIDGKGIDIIDVNNNTIHMNSQGVVINGVVIDRNGNIKAPGDVTTGNNVTLETHVHSDAGGSGNSGQPVPGS